MSESPRVRVLLADDHAVVRAGIRDFLESAEDIQIVAEAENGLQPSRPSKPTGPMSLYWTSRCLRRAALR